MFGRKQDIVAQQIERAKIKLLDEMDTYSSDSPEYKLAFEQFTKISALPSRDKKRIDPNTIVIVVGNLLIPFMIVVYEQKHVFTSKGLSFTRVIQPTSPS